MRYLKYLALVAVLMLPLTYSQAQVAVGVELGRATLAQRRYALTATTGIILTLARLTATTDLTGLRAECLSAPARGMAGDGGWGYGRWRLGLWSWRLGLWSRRLWLRTWRLCRRPRLRRRTRLCARLRLAASTVAAVPWRWRIPRRRRWLPRRWRRIPRWRRRWLPRWRWRWTLAAADTGNRGVIRGSP